MVHTLTRQEATTRAEQIRVDSYDVTVDLSGALDPARTTFGSEVTVRFTAEQGAETFIDFIHESVSLVQLNGAELAVDDVVEGSRIRLPELRHANELTVVGRAYYSRSGEGLHRFVDPQDGQVYTYTQYEPADCRRVFAVFEQPDLKASFTITVLTPPDWLAASNGEEVTVEPAPEAEVHGAMAHEFAPTARISSYITTVLAGPYTRVTDQWEGTDRRGEPVSVPLALYCRRALAEHLDADELFRVTRQGLEFFTELFAFDYPFGKYEQAFVPEYNLGAMENPGLVTLTEDYLFPSGSTRAQRASRAETMMHEMSHMWFGDLVTMRWWDDLWLKESFAEFMGAFACVRATEYGDAWVGFALRRKEWAYRQDQLPTTHPIVADIVDLEAARQNFDGITYAKGASVLKQLVAFVGEEAFVGACRAYFRRFAFGTTDLSDFLEVLQEACDADVRAWADAWLLTAGVPSLRLVVERGGATVTGAHLAQVACPPRAHVVAVAGYAPDPVGAVGTLQRVVSTRVRVDSDTPVELPEFTGRDVSVVLVNDEDLTYCLGTPEPPELAALADAADRLADPLARALAHSQVWSAVRDTRWDPGAYVELVANRCLGEQHSGILTTVVDRAVQAVEWYVPASMRASRRAHLLHALHEGLSAAPEGSDTQLILARAFARVAAHDDTFAPWIVELLAGERVVRGLMVGPQLGWSLWAALAATGHATRAQLDAAARRDGSAANDCGTRPVGVGGSGSGQVGAPSREARLGHARALAALPAPEVKAAAWESLSRAELSNDELSAVIAGFRLGPPELLEPYDREYFTAVDMWWQRHSMEIATRLVAGLYPRVLDAAPWSPAHGPGPEHPVVEATETWLRTRPQAPAALRRLMTELLDDAKRSLRVQAQSSTVTTAPLAPREHVVSVDRQHFVRS